MRIRWPCDPVGALALLFVCSFLGACQAFLTLDPETSTPVDGGGSATADGAIASDATLGDASSSDTNAGDVDPKDGTSDDALARDASADAMVADATAWTWTADFEDGGIGNFLRATVNGATANVVLDKNHVWRVNTTASHANAHLELLADAAPGGVDCELDWRVIPPASDAGPFALVTLMSFPGDIRRQVELTTDGRIRIFDYDATLEVDFTPTAFAPSAWNRLHVHLARPNADQTLSADLNGSSSHSTTFGPPQAGHVFTIGANDTSAGWTVDFDNVHCRLE